MPIQRISLFFHRNQQSAGTGATNKDRVLNPAIGWRKVTSNAAANGDCPCDDLQNQEVFNDSTATGEAILSCMSNPNSTCNQGCCPSKTKPNQVTTLVKNNRTYHYDYNQYLKRKCKGLYAKSFQHGLNTSTHLGAPQCSSSTVACVGDVCSAAPTVYKPNNVKHSKQGAVSSSARLLRLKTDMKQGCAGTAPCWTKQKYANSQVSEDAVYNLTHGRSFFPPPRLAWWHPTSMSTV